MLNAFSYYQETLCETSKTAFSIVFIISMTNFSKCVYLAVLYNFIHTVHFLYCCLDTSAVGALLASCSVFVSL